MLIAMGKSNKTIHVGCLSQHEGKVHPVSNGLVPTISNPTHKQNR